jgi:hypothetical protein
MGVDWPTERYASLPSLQCKLHAARDILHAQWRKCAIAAVITIRHRELAVKYTMLQTAGKPVFTRENRYLSFECYPRTATPAHLSCNCEVPCVPMKLIMTFEHFDDCHAGS